MTSHALVVMSSLELIYIRHTKTFLTMTSQINQSKLKTFFLRCSKILGEKSKA